jgi:hypothetical protein
MPLKGDDSAFSLQSGYATMGPHQGDHGLLFVADGAFPQRVPLCEGRTMLSWPPDVSGVSS